TAVQLGARAAADPAEFGAGGGVLADAQVEVPGAEVDRDVPVVQGDRGRGAGGADLPGGTLDDRAEVDVLPVVGEDGRDQAEERLLVDRERPDVLGAARGRLDDGGFG